MDWDSITRTGARAPGVERWNRSHGGACKRIIPDTEQGVTMQQGARRTMANQPAGKASSDSPALEPYRGKPAVRNFRGGDGNVGIIRSPVRAIALPDRRLLGTIFGVDRDCPACSDLQRIGPAEHWH